MSWALPLALLFLVACMLALPSLPPGVTNDDSFYTAAAIALARGEGYVQLFIAGHPPENRYPPGYPLYLSVAEWLFPGSWQLSFALLTGLAWLGFMACCYRLARAELGCSRLAAAGGVALVGAHPILLANARMLMSDALGAFLFMAALLLAYPTLRGEPIASWRQVLVALLLAAAALTRPAALAPIGVLCATWLWKREWKPLLLSGGMVGAVMLLWFRHAAQHGSASVPLSVYGQFMSLFTAWEFLSAHFWSTVDLVGMVLPSLHASFFLVRPDFNKPGPGLVLAGSVLGLYMIHAAWRQGRRQPPLAMLLLSVVGLAWWAASPALYMRLDLLARYSTIALPILAIWSLQCMEEQRGKAVASLILLLGLGSHVLTLGWVHARLQQQVFSRYQAEEGLWRYVREAVPPDAVIASSHPGPSFFRAGRDGSGLPQTEAQLLGLLRSKRPVYLLDAPFFMGSEDVTTRDLQALQRAHPKAWIPIGGYRDPVTGQPVTLWKLDGSKLPQAPRRPGDG